ncbi:BgTH12-00720 [Blumeria graminis f. sp. triticale]|uniref:BgTH12-00720 n=2 Tax=Blumeria graminis TaxID=34373 RepID=A0A9W4D6T9_BLUGR|nr:BgTH12-00720 [Blumeria graminis f. sp. triticale]
MSVNISQEELFEFHTAHFSKVNRDHFAKHFLGPVAHLEDHLGYYEDGSERTLTDAQICIFRHTEIQNLFRERQYMREAMGEMNPDNPSEIQIPKSSDAISSSSNKTNVKRPSNKERKALKAKQKGYFKPNNKPDLRKRTWDKVEPGYGSLNYDEAQGSVDSSQLRSLQRRRISYGES